MTHAIAASCTTGTWQQKWSCGWHQPVNTHMVNAGYFAGHNIAPWGLVAIGVFLLLIFTRRVRVPAASRK